MPVPKTLLQLAGAPADPAPLGDAALVIIDAQGEYRDGALPLDGFEAAVTRLADLLERARAAGTPVIHVAHCGAAGGVFDRDGPGGAIVAELAPRDGELVIEKRNPNAFAGTDLAARLAAIGRPQVVMAGFMTHMCVSSTARAALDLGHRVTIPADATATRALPDPLGGAALGAAEIQRAALAELADRFAVIVPAAAIVA
jgi:nicotinamidase-related amidase